MGPLICIPGSKPRHEVLNVAKGSRKKKVHPLVAGRYLSVGIITWLLQYFPKNRAILVQKLWGEKKLSKPFFDCFKTKKKIQKKKFRWPLSSRGGGKALVARPLVDEFFLRLPLRCSSSSSVLQKHTILLHTD